MGKNMTAVLNELCKGAEALGFKLRPQDILIQDGYQRALFVYGTLVNVSHRKFGAYKDNLYYDITNPITHNGRKKDGTEKLGELFANTLDIIESEITNTPFNSN